MSELIGEINATVSETKTIRHGFISITFHVMPREVKVIHKLIQNHMERKGLYRLAISELSEEDIEELRNEEIEDSLEDESF